ncbi:MAG: DegT/DnrJ/EryC1/StrS family aminotransferase, partial [Flavobacteriales bacterium]|nr:DegT/DnrJ/EryC1/StrS family aminotransferase [Flavobacteriales bacterium]
EPVFVDIDPTTCCIDPTLIEAAITRDTTAILATHVYGIPCDVEAIDVIAKKHGLKVIYDAAHAFDVEYKGKTILRYGDASTLSFHATKLFHTVEGGAVILHDEETDHRLRLLRSFGHIGDAHYTLGVNAKMSEVHAAMGMAVLPHVQECIRQRKELDGIYRSQLADLPVRLLPTCSETLHNYAYFPIFFGDGAVRSGPRETRRSGHLSRQVFLSLAERVALRSERTLRWFRNALRTRHEFLPFYPDLPAHVPGTIARIIREVTAEHTSIARS